MVRATKEEPEGLVYRPELIPVEEEERLLESFEALRFDQIVLYGRTARRTARHFGLDYDYGARKPRSGEPVPPWLLGVRARAAELVGRTADELAEVLVQRYPPGATIGWHRDAPQFGDVVGISLLGGCRLRLQRGTDSGRRLWEIRLERRSGYALTGSARATWQHSIPPVAELRYSITFRTLCPTVAGR